MMLRRVRGWRSRVGVTLAGLVFAGVVMGMVGILGLFAYYAKDLPNPDKIVRREGFATKIYDRNGKLLYDVFSGARRNPVDINQVPLTVKQATIAIEDKNFYKHGGRNFAGGLQKYIFGQTSRRIDVDPTISKERFIDAAKNYHPQTERIYFDGPGGTQIHQRPDIADVFE